MFTHFLDFGKMFFFTFFELELMRTQGLKDVQTCVVLHKQITALYLGLTVSNVKTTES